MIEGLAEREHIKLLSVTSLFESSLPLGKFADFVGFFYIYPSKQREDPYFSKSNFRTVRLLY